MKKVLASIGIGNATVDTVLPTETVRPGDTVDAVAALTRISRSARPYVLTGDAAIQ